jgi:hypothetical protein
MMFSMFFRAPKFSPASIMLLIAILLDVIPWILLICGVDDLGILELIATLTITPWLILNTGKLAKVPTKADFIKKIMTDKKWRFIVTYIGELVPIIDLLPWYTWIVYYQLIAMEDAAKIRQQNAQAE